MSGSLPCVQDIVLLSYNCACVVVAGSGDANVDCTTISVFVHSISASR